MNFQTAPTTNLHLHLVGTRSPRVPQFPTSDLGRGWNASLPESGVRARRFNL